MLCPALCVVAFIQIRLKYVVVIKRRYQFSYYLRLVAKKFFKGCKVTAFKSQ